MSALGRGFDALIPTEIDSSLIGEENDRVQKLLITKITPNAEQPRRQWDEQALKELSSSIKQHGVIQPIIVTKRGDGYEIVAGERRWRAAKLAGLKELPAIVRSLKELEVVELALIENIQRVDLSPLEQALAVLKLQQQFSLSLDQISKKLGKAQSTISNISRLLQLPETAKKALKDGRISEGHARAILALKGDEPKQAELLQCILDNGWTVRQAEQFVTNAKNPAKKSIKNVVNSHDTDIVQKLQNSLKTSVKISRRAKGGNLNINFSDDDQLSQIVKLLEK